MSMPLAGAYETMRRLALDLDQRRADKAYWQAVRAQTKAAYTGAAKRRGLPEKSGFPISPRACMRCSGDCVVLTVRGEAIDYCPACRRRWPILERSKEANPHATRRTGS